ncbi:threonine ammonia-lyase [Pseudooctadecabacter jejudonensis]|uniref:L-threonine dehydratase catabolic TdcB n=1 Tax=Pseudooctadecabacter jejudonensis TaxID=1391910 RepID=A0A1Y5SRE7_9RHOB|nr:threonine/serine dehydratase [Pseudooctadecabacter jejudonensis]SLN45285.1 L-threonine dehydratase catabolic TdcB [Pseudooctadecabacter jejudonensis]
MTDACTIDDIRTAARRLRGHARRTPLLSSPFLDDLAGRRVLLKPECLQHTGSFKFRGAYNAISAMDPNTRARGVIAFSSGNHAQGVAYAAALHGTTSTIIMPADAPQLKIDNTRALGATVVLYDRDTEDRDDIGARLAADQNLTLIKPFDNGYVIAGQGTTGLEIAEDAAALDITDADVLVCCGGGGLTSGIALALEADAPTLTARPVEPTGFDDVKRSLEAGEIKRNPATSGNICDAIITPQPGDLTFPILKRLCGAGLTVTEDQCLQAMAHAFLRLKLVLEPGGAAALAAALFSPGITTDTVIATLSGGNVDPAMFTRALDTVA